MDRLFTVLNKDGTEITNEQLENLADEGNLISCDIDGFYIDENGDLTLLDECGNAMYLNTEDYKIVFNEEMIKKMKGE